MLDNYPMGQSLPQRMKKYFADYEDTPKRFAARIGMTEAAMYRIMSGTIRKPRILTVKAIEAEINRVVANDG